LTYKESRSGSAPVDRAARYLLPDLPGQGRIVPFDPYGYDERQFCSPGFDLPVGRLTRSPNGTYLEYHSSADNPDFVTVPALAQSLQALGELLDLLDANRTCLNLAPKGEPRLGKRGLYGSLGGGAPGEFENALLWVLNQSDGGRDLLSIAERSGVSFWSIEKAATALERVGLLEVLDGQGRPEGSFS
jgi:aminopeptidase-like protein